MLPPLQALFVSYGGYLNLVANAATRAARWLLPLSFAPYATIATALAFQLCPPSLLLTARDTWLHPVPVRLVALLLILLVPASEEVGLHTLHCQFQLLLCCGIILALDTTNGWRAALRLCLLFLAPLCGPVAIALLPLFLLRAAAGRAPARLAQAAALGLAAGVQLLLFFHIVPSTSITFNPLTLFCAPTLYHLDLPFLGLSHANAVAGLLRARRAMSRCGQHSCHSWHQPPSSPWRSAPAYQAQPCGC